jgi:histidinol phosphatase-like enzyme (inositol monophosphatase family)
MTTRSPDADFLHRLADLADQETLPRFRRPLAVDAKSDPGREFDPVTEADRRAEIVMRELIGAEYPTHAILGEEFGSSGAGALQWVIDPIDGTKPYLCGIPVWGTLIGLVEGGLATLGMMSQPVTSERFWADSSGAWHRSPAGTRRLAVRKLTNLSQAILHTTSPDQFPIEGRAAFASLKNSVRMTRYGGECYAFAMLAAGCIDICVEPNLKPYDIIPIIPIVEKAGGVVTRFDGRRAESGGAVLLSATPELHEKTLAILNE